MEIQTSHFPVHFNKGPCNFFDSWPILLLNYDIKTTVMIGTLFDM